MVNYVDSDRTHEHTHSWWNLITLKANHKSMAVMHRMVDSNTKRIIISKAHCERAT